MILAYPAHLSLKVRVTYVSMQKIDRSSLANYSMVITSFQVIDKLGCSRFFQGIFLLADINMEVILSMLLFTFSNADV